MWSNIKRFLIVASFALNLAVASVWIVHTVPAGLAHEETELPAPTAQIWCPLHQQLDVSGEQWKKIEPQLKQFRESAQSVARQIGRFRSEVLDLIAMPTPDRDAITAKQEKIRTCQRKMQDMVVDHLLAEKEILTVEQGEQLTALLREHSSGDRGGHAGLSGAPQRGFGQVLREEPKAD
jgi:Spy/CpxP family protein refolding chaperone